MGNSSQARRKKCGILQIDLQDKHIAAGSIEKYKAKILVHGFSQKERIEYEETFDLVARYTSIITIMELTSMLKSDLHQMDVKKASLYGVIEEEVYIERPQGFEFKDKKHYL